MYIVKYRHIYLILGNIALNDLHLTCLKKWDNASLGLIRYTICVFSLHASLVTDKVQHLCFFLKISKQRLSQRPVHPYFWTGSFNSGWVKYLEAEVVYVDRHFYRHSSALTTPNTANIST